MILVNGAAPRSPKSHLQKEDAESRSLMKAIYMMAIVFSPIICRIPGKRQTTEGNQKRFCKQAKSYFCVFFEHGAGYGAVFKKHFSTRQACHAYCPIPNLPVWRFQGILNPMRAKSVHDISTQRRLPSPGIRLCSEICAVCKATVSHTKRYRNTIWGASGAIAAEGD